MRSRQTLTVGIDDPEVMATMQKEHVQAGFNVIKTKVGVDFASDLAESARSREQSGTK